MANDTAWVIVIGQIINAHLQSANFQIMAALAFAF